MEPGNWSESLFLKILIVICVNLILWIHEMKSSYYAGLWNFLSGLSSCVFETMSYLPWSWFLHAAYLGMLLASTAYIVKGNLTNNVNWFLLFASLFGINQARSLAMGFEDHDPCSFVDKWKPILCISFCFIFVFSMGRPLVNGDGSCIAGYSYTLNGEDKTISGNKLCTGSHVIYLAQRSVIFWEVLRC